jgi:RND family efflux transporter MFP subunit
MIRTGRKDASVTVALADDLDVTTTARIREVAPQANAVTGAYVVKVGLDEPPEAMRLGATVVGRISLSSNQVVRLPGAALTQVDNEPGVWVVEPKAMTVASRKVKVVRFDSDTVIINDGLVDGEIVVTAGIHALRPGQQVRLLDRIR